MFKHPVHNVLQVVLFLGVVMFLVSYTLIAKSIVAPILAANVNVPNQFKKIDV